ncbi:flagellar basal body rod modification protein [Liquorilactobacillus nagelii]|uniref:flagellar basal body rod modification protein n=1 Tax=Liquorilactobacillus nagelii TaxID=82688 RepID=UPI0039E9A7F7
MNNSLTDAIASLASSNIYNADSSSSKTTVSMDDFLKIMSATMSNPSMDGSSSSGGGSSTDYMTSLAQYESLNTLMAMNKSLTASVAVQQQQEALGMLGKQVTLIDNGQSVSGKVDQVKFSNGLATLVVNGKEYQLSSLSEVGEGK